VSFERARLLVDLLQHEVLEAAALGHHRAPVDPLRRAIDLQSLQGLDPSAGHAELGHLAVLEQNHVSRVGEKGGDVAPAKGFAFADPEHER